MPGDIPTAIAPDGNDPDDLIDGVLSAGGVDLWGVAANSPPLPLAPLLPAAVSLAMRIDPHSLDRLEQGDPRAYRAEYRRLNQALDEASAALTAALLAAGAAAEPLPATVYTEWPTSGDWLAAGVFAHKTAATRAGLGWIGKTALFVSPELGPRVRLATVFTDLPLTPAVPIDEGSCGTCTTCILACPVHAGRDVSWHAGMPREQLFDAAACERHMDRVDPTGHGTCGLCVAACPFGRPGPAVG